MPSQLTVIREETVKLNFTMASDEATGTLLRTLARTKPDGNLLELGTGTGVGTCWLLEGMNDTAHLTSVDNDAQAQSVAQQFLGKDRRVTFHCMDGGDFIQGRVSDGKRFDLIFADTWPGKFFFLDETLSLLKLGGLYVVDDLHPQSDWPADHPPKVEAFVATILQRDDLFVTQLDWSTGLIVAVKK